MSFPASSPHVLAVGGVKAPDGDKTAMIEDIRGLLALGTDITEADEITAVTDARGVVLIPGRLRVEGPIQHKHTHVEAALKRIA